MTSNNEQSSAALKSCPHRPTRMVLWLPFCAISLTGCQSPRTQTEIVQMSPPPVSAELLLPTSGPYRPGPLATQKDAADVINTFDAALAACNADKAAVAAILGLK